MSAIENKVQRLEESVSGIKIELAGVNHAISSQAAILKELKDVIVSQNSTLNYIHELKGRVDGIEDDLKSLQDDYKNRKEQTNSFIKEGLGFMERWRGGLAVAIFCFASAQGIVGYALYFVSDRIEQTSKDVRKIEIEVIKNLAKVEALKRKY